VRYFRRYILVHQQVRTKQPVKSRLSSPQGSRTIPLVLAREKKEVCIIPAAAAVKRRLHPLPNFYTKLKQAAGIQFRTLNFQQSTKISFQNELQL